VEQAALFGGRHHGDGVGRAGGTEVRAFQGIHGDVHRGLPRTHAHLLADVEHGGLVALPLADDDGPVHVYGLHGMAHGLHGELIAALPVPEPDAAGAGDGGLLDHPQEIAVEGLLHGGTSGNDRAPRKGLGMGGQAWRAVLEAIHSRKAGEPASTGN